MSDQKVLQLPLWRASQNKGYLYLVAGLLMLFLGALYLVEANRLELLQKPRARTETSTSEQLNTEPSSERPNQEKPT